MSIGESFAQKISIKLENVPLKEAVDVISDKANVKFVYSKEVINLNQKVTLNNSNIELRDALDIVFASTNIEYTIRDKSVILSLKRQKPAQQNGKLNVGGSVVSADNEPIIGATVIVVGSSQGTITSTDGSFYIKNVNKGAQLEISFLGYKTTLLPATKDNLGAIVLELDAEAMDEVVVVGYGTQLRSLVTSAISTVKVNESNLRQVSTPTQLLNGRVAGLSTSTSSGNLGSSERMSIRGASSITAGNEPLYVVDGVPIDNRSSNMFSFGESMSGLSAINTNDIESIEVLKDAASAAIYGSRASNGVIMITTRSGKSGRSDVKLNYNMGISQMPNVGKIKMANSDQYINIYNMGVENYNKQNGLQVGDSDYKIGIMNPFGDMPDTDWMGLILQTGISHNVDASVSGGDKKTTYYIGGNYNNQNGIIRSNSLNKININVKARHKFRPWLEIGANNSANFVHNNQVPGAGMGSTILGRTLPQRPFDRPYKPNGEYYTGGTEEMGYHNPIQILNEQVAYVENLRFIGSYFANVNITDKISFRSQYNADITQTYDYKYYNEHHPYGMGKGRIVDNNMRIINTTFDNFVNYNDTFDKFTMSAMAGHSYQKIDGLTAMIDGIGLPSPSFDVVGVTTEARAYSGGKSTYAIESYYGRWTGSYDKRYLVTLTARGDGSSKFAPEHRWAIFPSASIGWNISNEQFMEESDVDLKLRFSYGKTGNQGGISTYGYQATMGGGFDYGVNSGIATSAFGNYDLTWENSDQYDFGFDATFLDGRISAIFDVYYKQTNDLLYNMPVHATTGATSLISNIGSMQNVGAEFSINTDFNIGEVQWLSQFNISANRNKITALLGDDAPMSIGGNRALQVGKEMGVFYLYMMDGIYQYDGEVPAAQYDLGVRAGDVKWRDVDNNGIINDNDRQVTGSSNPDFFGGWNNTFRYKGFQLDLFFTYMYGNDVYAQWKVMTSTRDQRKNMTEDFAVNYWDGPGSTNVYPRAYNGDTNNIKSGSNLLEDGSFVRLRNLALSYYLPENITSKLGLKDMRVFLQGDNLCLFTKYSGWDPEVSNNMDPRYFGVDDLSVPQPRIITIGTNLTF